jgi:hypothetical protein
MAYLIAAPARPRRALRKYFRPESQRVREKTGPQSPDECALIHHLCLQRFPYDKGIYTSGHWSKRCPIWYDQRAIGSGAKAFTRKRGTGYPDRWYIKAMTRFRNHRYNSAFASVLVAVFFASQAFSCCLVNHRLGQFAMSLWAANNRNPSAHSCCPATQPSRENRNSDSAANKTCAKSGCCIQNANQKLPQMPSEQIPVPDMTGLALALLPMVSLDAPSLPTPPDLQSRSSPPVYLTHLRLLI